MQWFRVDLKTFLGLAMPNQCCHVVTKLILGWFVGEIFWQEIPNLNTIQLKHFMCKINYPINQSF